MKLIKLVRRTIFTTSHGAVFVKYGKYEPHKAGMHDFFRTKFGFGGHICWWRNSCEVEELLHLTLLRTGGEKTTFSFVFFSSRRQNLLSKGGGTLYVTPPEYSGLKVRSFLFFGFNFETTLNVISPSNSPYRRKNDPQWSRAVT